MTVATRVGRFMRWRRWRTMGEFANIPTGAPQTAVRPDFALSGVCLAVRPREAFITDMVEGHLMNEPKRIASNRPATEGIAVVLKSFVMRAAEAFSFMTLAAVRYGAYTGISHSDTSSVLAWLGRVEGCNPSARSSFVLEIGGSV